jgi:3-(3-hydroxy-phenyl)propionate hydroxylase/6-hydroxy-3-succinoylpyridine 3-monooxygenase
MEDVVIVGGGPVGFLNALGLAQAGVRVTLLESEPQIINSPRAVVYFATVLDVLEGHLAHPFNLHLGQNRLAEIALRRLQTLSNARVRFNTRLESLQQDAEGVTLTVMNAGKQETLRAKWVIGADGAGSTVRRQLGLSFDGMTWPERFVATNVYFDFERYNYKRTTILVDDQHGAIIAQIDTHGLWRCTYMEDSALPEATYLERLPAAYKGVLPGPGDYKVDQSRPYRMHQRSAPRYRVGRVVLLGASRASTPA